MGRSCEHPTEGKEGHRNDGQCEDFHLEHRSAPPTSGEASGYLGRAAQGRVAGEDHPVNGDFEPVFTSLDVGAFGDGDHFWAPPVAFQSDISYLGDIILAVNRRYQQNARLDRNFWGGDKAPRGPSQDQR
jgi:hypothetical protein